MATLQFFLIVTFGLTGACAALRLCSGPLEANRRKFYACLCWASSAIVLGAGGLISVLRISHSPRPYLEGTISSLRQYSGRSSVSYFDLRNADGSTISLRMNHHARELANGEMVRVQILANYKALLNLEVLSGPNAGWRQTDADGLRSAYIGV
jgi:hypothetical protein